MTEIEVREMLAPVPKGWRVGVLSLSEPKDMGPLRPPDSDRHIVIDFLQDDGFEITEYLYISLSWVNEVYNIHGLQKEGWNIFLRGKSSDGVDWNISRERVPGDGATPRQTLRNLTARLSDEIPRYADWVM